MTTLTITDTEFKQLRDYIEKNCGISLGDEKLYLVESRLAKLLSETGVISYGQLYQKAISDTTLSLRDKIVDAMTTNETTWFRDSYPFEIFDKVILKQYTDEIASGKRKRIRVWSAGSSTGQEAYSIAMTIQEYARKCSVLPLQYIEIVGTDISPTALFLSIAGRYDSISIARGLSDELRERYFTPSGKIWLLNDKIKKMATFKKFNLQDDPSLLGTFDIIFCRNVIIYFSDAFKKQLLRNFAQLLQPSGYLFLGSAESVTQFSNEFVMEKYGKYLYYRCGRGGRV